MNSVMVVGLCFKKFLGLWGDLKEKMVLAISLWPIRTPYGFKMCLKSLGVSEKPGQVIN